MIEADSVHSTPPLNSSANNVIPLFGKRPRPAVERINLWEQLRAEAVADQEVPRTRRRNKIKHAYVRVPQL